MKPKFSPQQSRLVLQPWWWYTIYVDFVCLSRFLFCMVDRFIHSLEIISTLALQTGSRHKLHLSKWWIISLNDCQCTSSMIQQYVLMYGVNNVGWLSLTHSNKPTGCEPDNLILSPKPMNSFFFYYSWTRGPRYISTQKTWDNWFTKQNCNDFLFPKCQHQVWDNIGVKHLK